MWLEGCDGWLQISSSFLKRNGCTVGDETTPLVSRYDVVKGRQARKKSFEPDLAISSSSMHRQLSVSLGAIICGDMRVLQG